MIETDILRAELERLFDLDELMSLSNDLLGFDPESVGGTAAKASFAAALTSHCLEHDAIEALCDAVIATRRQVNQKVSDLRMTGVMFDEDLRVGSELGPYTILRKLGEGRLAISYVARKAEREYRLKVLRREATRDERGLHRYLTVNRLIAKIQHPGLPEDLSAGLAGGRYVVAHRNVTGLPLSARMARSGPTHFAEARALLRGILEPLAALHERQLSHGDLRLDNVIWSRTPEGTEHVVLVDAGSDRLRARARLVNGRNELFSTVGSPRTVSPEQIRGAVSDARSDVYSFGAMLYEILSGKALFADRNALDAAFGHLSEMPPPPSSLAPRGFISKPLDQLVLRLLDKDPEKRPESASIVLELLESLGRASVPPTATAITPAELEAKTDALLRNPTSEEAAIDLEAAVQNGADLRRVAESLVTAAELVADDDAPAIDTKKALLFRAARLFASSRAELESAEDTYLKISELDPEDNVARSGLEDVRRRLGKFEELVEMLLSQSDQAESPSERARAFAEIGRVYAQELKDIDQGLVAFTQAFSEEPEQAELATEIERLAGTRLDAWGEVLSTCQDGAADTNKPVEVRNAILNRMGRWYLDKLHRPDLSLPCFQQVLVSEPSSETALAGMTEIYRKAEQWAELGMVLTRRADAAPTPARGRDLRAEAAEILDQHLSDTRAARALYEQILAEDPGHARASNALAKIYERTRDFTSYIALLERRAEGSRGEERFKVLCRIAELYETELADNDEALRRYTSILTQDPRSLEALRGLDRLYAKLGRFQDLLDNLERQIQLAATPRQKVTLWERVAAIYEEEFLDHTKAADALESLLELAPDNDSATTALIRHYRAEGRWEAVAERYQRQLTLVTEAPRRLPLLLQQGAVFAQQIGSPERAMQAYEAALAIDPQHAGALEALARLRESSGDAGAALAAIETLAAKANTPEGKAEQFMRAAKLLEARGDRDGAIERYKLALDANPKAAAAGLALREAYAARGDVHAAMQLIERELLHTDGELAKAKLTGQMAMLAYEGLKDAELAQETAKAALELDPTNLDAQYVLADVAFEDNRYLLAVKYYDSLAARADALDKERAIRVLVRYVDALSQTGSTEKAVAPMDTLLRIAPDDADALERVALVTFEHGTPERAAELYKDLLDRFEDTLQSDSRARALYGYGEAQRVLGLLEEALPALETAAELDPLSPEPMLALANVFEAQERWADVVRVKTKLLDIAEGSQRVDLLVEIGEIASGKLGDRAQAAKSFVAALDERPDDRRLLTKLMQLYSEEKDWNKLVDVVLRLADFVDDPKQKAKYLHTAAIVTARQVGDVDRALTFYEKVLDLEPEFDKALNEAIGIELDRNNHAGVERWLKRKLEWATAANDQPAMLESFVQLGDLYEHGFGDIDKAIDAFEAAETLESDNRERTEHLSALYATNPEQYLPKAVAARGVLLRQNPYSAESYKGLRKLYTETKQADASWCLCQALSVLNLAEPDEQRFFNRMRSDTAAPAQAALTGEDWLELVMHADADPLLTDIFTLIEPTIVAKRSQALTEFGYDPADAIDLGAHPAPVCQSLYYAAGVLGIELPPVYENRNDRGGLSFLFAPEPSLVLGRTALRDDVPLQPAAFIAGQKLSFLRPGLYLRQLLASGTALKSWLFAAIKLTSPQFPVAPELEGAVYEAYMALDAGLQGQPRDQLTRAVVKLLTSGAALDLKRWVAGVDLTADRAGLILAHDLETATDVVKASDQGSSTVSEDERFKELLLFSVSPEYFEIRRRLQIAVDS